MVIVMVMALFAMNFVLFTVRSVVKFNSINIYQWYGCLFNTLGMVIVIIDILRIIIMMIVNFVIISIWYRHHHWFLPELDVLGINLTDILFRTSLFYWNEARRHYWAPCNLRPGKGGLCWHYEEVSITDLAMGREINPCINCRYCHILNEDFKSFKFQKRIHASLDVFFSVWGNFQPIKLNEKLTIYDINAFYDVFLENNLDENVPRYNPTALGPGLLRHRYFKNHVD